MGKYRLHSNGFFFKMLKIVRKFIRSNLVKSVALKTQRAAQPMLDESKLAKYWNLITKCVNMQLILTQSQLNSLFLKQNVVF